MTARTQAQTPFFLYLALNSLHTPIVPSKEWQGKSGLGDYGDFVMQTDAAIGEVLDALDRTDVAKRTLIVVTSDNGCSPAAGVEKLKKKGISPAHICEVTKAIFGMVVIGFHFSSAGLKW